MILQEYFNPGASTRCLLEDDTDPFGNKVKNLYLEGIFIQADLKNHNGRVYPLHEIRKAVNTLNEQISNNIPILGELDHPADLKINLDRVTHDIKKMWMDGTNGIGKLRILPTPMGDIAKAMIETGVNLGVSSRGSGNVDDYSGRVSDFEIITVDIVAQPSAPDARPAPLYESLLNMKHGHKLIEMAQDAQSNVAFQKYVGEEVLRFIKDLKL